MHTPGPWTHREVSHPDDARLKGFRIEGFGIVVAEIHLRPYAVAIREDNARLIAAAPDMLAALVAAEKVLVAAYGEPDGSPLSSKTGEAAIKTVRAAIAKATGSE